VLLSGVCPWTGEGRRKERKGKGKEFLVRIRVESRTGFVSLKKIN
jgi:hypothetical protein